MHASAAVRALVLLIPLSTACAPEVDLFAETGGAGGVGAEGPGPGPGPSSGPGTGGVGASGVGGGVTSVSSTATGSMCTDPNADIDGDGFTANTGDCNDCDAAQSPNAYDFGGNGLDDDCSGAIDDTPPPCDQTIEMAEDDAPTVAKAIELCKTSAGPNSWGLVGAKWVLADGSDPPSASAEQLIGFHLGHGVLDDFGPNVATQAGARLLALSSGRGRRPGDPDYQPSMFTSKNYTSAHPAGFPKETPTCPGAVSGGGNDATAIEVVVRVPSNARGFAYSSNFYAIDWPTYVCSQYNDFFVAIMSPVPAGLTDGNLAFDPAGNPFSLNGAPFDVCACATPPCMAGGKPYTCSQGNAQLVGTGFGVDSGNADHAATGWQRTTAPVEAGTEITLRFGIYDSGDMLADSTALVDAWRWLAETPKVETLPDP